MTASRVEKVGVNGIGLHVEIYGEGPAILGIHGTPSSALAWVDAAEELARRGRCIIYDRRGFGRSERPEPFDTVDLADHVGDAAALLNALDAVPAVVVGRSTGGQIALGLALRHARTVRALVLLEPALFSVDPDAAAWARALRERVLRAAADDPTAAAEFVVRDALGDETWESLPADLRTALADASPAVLAEMRGAGLDLSDDPLAVSAGELAAIGVPTLVVSSEDSPQACRIVNARLAELMGNVETALVPGGHLIDPAHPVVLDFVDRALAAT